MPAEYKLSVRARAHSSYKRKNDKTSVELTLTATCDENTYKLSLIKLNVGYRYLTRVNAS